MSCSVVLLHDQPTSFSSHTYLQKYFRSFFHIEVTIGDVLLPTNSHQTHSTSVGRGFRSQLSQSTCEKDSPLQQSWQWFSSFAYRFLVKIGSLLPKQPFHFWRALPIRKLFVFVTSIPCSWFYSLIPESTGSALLPGDSPANAWRPIMES